MLQGFYFWDLRDHRFLKMFAKFLVLFRNWTLSLSLKKSKIGPVISFLVSFHLILLLSLINCIINQFPLLIAFILIMELEVLFIYKYITFSYAWFSPRNLVHKFRRKKFYSLYAFELMILFLAEESFLNMHSYILLNLTSGVWMV